jgi:lipoyl(octanoyl) transferase
MEQSAEKSKNHSLSIRDCGLAAYREILALQQQLHNERLRNQIPDTVLIVEHHPVITLGARASANRFLISPEEIARRGVDLVEVRRGGGVTAHNPGQLVFYPIVHLKERGLGINEYIRELESIGIELLTHLGVPAGRQQGFPGLWLENRKLASIGVRVSKGVTYHGMAINIQNDLSIFELIVPCGLDGVEMTSVLKETAKCHPMTDAKKCLSALLPKHFGNERREPVMVCTAHPSI